LIFTILLQQTIQLYQATLRRRKYARYGFALQKIVAKTPCQSLLLATVFVVQELCGIVFLAIEEKGVLEFLLSQSEKKYNIHLRVLSKRLTYSQLLYPVHLC